MDERKSDHDMLVHQSLECRRKAEQAETLAEREQWIKMADLFLRRAEELDD